MKKYLYKSMFQVVKAFGLDLRDMGLSIVGMPKYIVSLILFMRRLRRVDKDSIDYQASLEFVPILKDFKSGCGDYQSLYFMQDLACSQFCLTKTTGLHLDIGSRVDGFVAQIAASRPITVVDIRPMEAKIQNINFICADLFDMQSCTYGQFDIVSALHSLEHIGLGRYSDVISPGSFEKAVKKTFSLCKSDGIVLISVPLHEGANNIIQFNSQRVFSSSKIINTYSRIIDDSGLVWWCGSDDSRLIVENECSYELDNYLKHFKGFGFLVTAWQKFK